MQTSKRYFSWLLVGLYMGSRKNSGQNRREKTNKQIKTKSKSKMSVHLHQASRYTNTWSYPSGNTEAKDSFLGLARLHHHGVDGSAEVSVCNKCGSCARVRARLWYLATRGRCSALLVYPPNLPRARVFARSFTPDQNEGLLTAYNFS